MLRGMTPGASKSPKVPNSEYLRLAGFTAGSRVNGPGRRVVIWVQGCDLACPGCFNPHTWPADGPGEPVQAVADRILRARAGHDGVTFSGGEPFQQAAALARVAADVRARWPAARLMAFTGYRLDDLRGPDGPPGAGALLRQLDWLIDGPYDPRRPSRRPWRASAGQRLWVVGRPLPPGAIEGATADAELHVSSAGEVLLSGFPDAALRRAVRRL